MWAAVPTITETGRRQAELVRQGKVRYLGLCEAAPCRNAYLDTSTNRSRRYCSDRCRQAGPRPQGQP